MNFIENTLCVLAPSEIAPRPGYFPYHEPKEPLRIQISVESVRKFAFNDCLAQDSEELKAVLLETNLKILDAAADLWFGKASFFEVFEPCAVITQHLANKECSKKLSTGTQVNRLHKYMTTC